MSENEKTGKRGPTGTCVQAARWGRKGFEDEVLPHGHQDDEAPPFADYGGQAETERRPRRAAPYLGRALAKKRRFCKTKPFAKSHNRQQQRDLKKKWSRMCCMKRSHLGATGAKEDIWASRQQCPTKAEGSVGYDRIKSDTVG